jgi:cell wall-associated NlpC family hydrolase
VYFIGVVIAAFTIMISLIALEIGQAGHPAATHQDRVAIRTATTPPATAEDSLARRRAAEAAAIRHAKRIGHLAHVKHLAHLAYLRGPGARPVRGPGARPAEGQGTATPTAKASANLTTGTRAQLAVEWALRQVGIPYLWGGTGNGGFDCSGLVMSAWASAGVLLPRTSYEQASAGTRIGRDQLQPGDLVFTNGFGHVAMYSGGGRIVQAPSAGRTVNIVALPSPGAIDAYVRVPSPVSPDNQLGKLEALKYLVRPGDTLESIARRMGGGTAGWPWLYQANRSRISDPGQIFPGQLLTIPYATSSGDAVHPMATGAPTRTVPAKTTQARTAKAGTLGCADLETLWERAGGPPSSARIAASIAMAESSGRQYATGGAGERGYWQINPDHGSLSTYDPLANAHAAVILSGKGTNWSAWTTYTSGVYAGRC